MTFIWNAKTKFNIFSATIVSQADTQISSLDVLYQNTDNFTNNHLKTESDKRLEEINKSDISKIPEADLQILTQSISSYFGLSHEAQNILSNYIIVATFSFYEKSFKQILDLTGQLTHAQLRNCYKASEAKKILKNKFGIEYDQLADSAKVNELRCINNDIKHNGIVGNELSIANSKWQQGQFIENTYNDFQRLKEGPVNLLRDLAEKIEYTL